MKSLKLLAAGLLAFAVAGSASAQTTVKLTGSTAFRASTIAAIINSLNSPTAAWAGSAANVGAANQVIIRGTLKSGPSAGQDVAFQTAFQGSVGGVQVLTANLTQIPLASYGPTATWLTTANTLTPVSVTVSGNVYTFTGGTGGQSTFQSAGQTADGAMSDSYQASSPFKTPVLTDYQGGVGVVPFVWAKGADNTNVPAASYGRLTNISTQQAKQLMTAGFASLELFTSNGADSGIDVVLAGRDADSGTRLCGLAEVNYGALPNQVSLTVAGGVITAISAPNLGVGENSGGTLATKVNTPAGSLTDSNGKPFIVVSFFGVSDAKTIALGNGSTLAYNGTAAPIISGGALDIFASGLAATIEQGQYTFWDYEHLLHRTGLAGVQLNALNAVGDQIINVDALAAGIQNGQMNAARNDEFSPVFSFN
jgi:hypothetical protein